MFKDSSDFNFHILNGLCLYLMALENKHYESHTK